MVKTRRERKKKKEVSCSSTSQYHLPRIQMQADACSRHRGVHSFELPIGFRATFILHLPLHPPFLYNCQRALQELLLSVLSFSLHSGSLRSTCFFTNTPETLLVAPFLYSHLIRPRPIVKPFLKIETKDRVRIHSSPMHLYRIQVFEYGRDD